MKKGKYKYVVMVDDNYHYADEDARYKYGEYDTPEEAIHICKKIVENSIKYKAGVTAKQLLSDYTMFGDSPFVLGGGVHFSASDYAKEYCEKICTQDQQ
ncbi:MAG: hypothetical protein JJT94_06475 [Bernardetiaceae bacterium]|nr:hypothetical protein [Bernardetiaceae bacterium]